MKKLIFALIIFSASLSQAFEIQPGSYKNSESSKLLDLKVHARGSDRAISGKLYLRNVRAVDFSSILKRVTFDEVSTTYEAVGQFSIAYGIRGYNLTICYGTYRILLKSTRNGLWVSTWGPNTPYSIYGNTCFSDSHYRYDDPKPYVLQAPPKPKTCLGDNEFVKKFNASQSLNDAFIATKIPGVHSIAVGMCDQGDNSRANFVIWAKGPKERACIEQSLAKQVAGYPVCLWQGFLGPVEKE